jgi:hypothetical protein
MVTPDGIGAVQALTISRDILGPSCIANDHPRHLRQVPLALRLVPLDSPLVALAPTPRSRSRDTPTIAPRPSNRPGHCQ